MKYGNFPIILIILIVAFGIAFVLSFFVQFCPNGPSISGCIGPCPTQLAVTASHSSIYVNVTTNDPSIVQSTTLTVNDAISNCNAATIYWQSDIPGFFINSTGGTSAQSHPYCILNSACSCTIVFHSLNVSGTANIFASDKSNPIATTPGGTQVTINWTPTPCVGIVTQCGATGPYTGLQQIVPVPIFLNSNSCAAQQGCAWFNPNPTYQVGYCYGCGYGDLGNYGYSDCSAHRYIGCAWSNGDASLYPMCGGAISFDCSQFNGDITNCVADQRCLYNSATNTCYDNKCSLWNSNSATCNSIGGCSYTTGPCAGTALSCASLTTQGSCSAQNGCSWVSGSNTLIQTTTTTTISGTTTTTISGATTSTTSTTSSTTTTTTAPSFTGNNFACSSITSGWLCNVTYNNNLGENAIVLFIYTNSNGNVVSSPAPVAQQGSGIASSAFYCTNRPTGTYYAAWKAFRQSDTNLQNAVAWSQSTERRTITC